MKIFKKDKILEFLIATLFITVGIVLRILPHAPNFTPIVAIALFGGVYFSKKIALILPIAVLAISDAFIGYYDLKLMAAVYGSFLLCVIFGFWLKKHKKWYAVGGGAILSSVIFFIITNFAVWALSPWYAKTFSGIIQCYLMALPFFKNTLLGDLFYTAAFFGIYEVIEVLIKEKFAVSKKVADFV